jgi:RNA polymerase sigma factor (sigma-70 family)
VAAVPTHEVAKAGASRVAAVAARHERTLLRVARQASLCDDDAHDAYQRALEIFLRRVDTVDPATEVAWLRVVVRHEAMAIRRSRSETVAGEELEIDEFVPGGGRDVEEVIAAGERVRRSAEALRALKPDEAEALMLKAHGLSYAEIGERCGWSYTKVNRAITEGRRRFMAAYAEIESGEECERFAPIVEALATGTATARQVLSIRPHIRHCTACKAAVRDLHLSLPQRASLFWPVFAAVEPLDRLSSPSVDERLRELSTDAPPVPSPDAIPVPQLTDGTLQSPLELPPLTERAGDVGRLEGLRHDISAFFHRAHASDLATGVHVASTSGGRRIATVAAVLGFCLSGAGVGTVCVISGLVPSPLNLIGNEPPGQATARARPPSKPRPAQPTATHPLIRATPPVMASATPAARRTRAVTRQRDATSRDPSQRTAPTSQENTPISPTPADSSGQDAFTPEAPQAAPPPTRAPATGGSEFAP